MSSPFRKCHSNRSQDSNFVRQISSENFLEELKRRTPIEGKSKYRRIKIDDEQQSDADEHDQKSKRRLTIPKNSIEQMSSKSMKPHFNSLNQIWIKRPSDGFNFRQQDELPDQDLSRKITRQPFIKQSPYFSQQQQKIMDIQHFHPKSAQDIRIVIPSTDSSIQQREFLKKCMDNASQLKQLKSPSYNSRDENIGGVTTQSSTSIDYLTSLASMKLINEKQQLPQIVKIDPISKYLRQKTITERNHAKRSQLIRHSLHSPPLQQSKFFNHLQSQSKLATSEQIIGEVSSLINQIITQVKEEVDSDLNLKNKSQKTLYSRHKYSNSMTGKEISFAKEQQQQIFRTTFQKGPDGYLFNLGERLNTTKASKSPSKIQDPIKQITTFTSMTLQTEVSPKNSVHTYLAEKCESLSNSVFTNLEKLKNADLSKRRIVILLKQFLPGTSLLRSFLLEEFRDYPVRLKENTNTELLIKYFFKIQQQYGHDSDVVMQFHSELFRLQQKLEDYLLDSKIALCGEYQNDIINSCQQVESILQILPNAEQNERTESSSKLIDSLSFNRLVNRAHSVVGLMDESIIKYGSLDRINQQNLKVATILENKIQKMVDARKNQFKKRNLFPLKDENEQEI